MNKRGLRIVAFTCLIYALLPSTGSAQSTISGVVRDASGAVVPQASVAASSDVLIEKERTVTTSNEGRYTIVDLRPGTYVVTANAPGFDTVRQTIEVPANVTVPVDATLKIGAVGETVSVEARVATVDVENAGHPTTLSRAEMDDLPNCRAYDTDNLTWRHLNFFQHQTFLHARTPRAECSHCGIHRVTVPWARPDSGFTLLFEALVMMLARAMPVLAVGRVVGEHDTLVWRIVTHT